MRNRDKAQRIYNQTRPNPEAVAMGFPLSPIQKVTLDELEAHMDLVDEVAAEYGVQLSADRLFGKSHEEIIAAAEVKIRRRKRSAGARALSRKYGKTAAENIIARKTGRRISLQS